MFDVPIHSLYAMLVVFGLLLISSGITGFKIRQQPEKDFTELYLRIRSWWWMIGLIFAALVAGKTLSIIFFAFVSFLALKEFFSIVPTRQADRRVLFWAYLSIPLQYYWVSIEWYGMFIIFIPVYMFLFLPMRMVLIGETSGFIKSAGVVHWATMLTVYCISHIAYLIALPIQNSSAGSIGLVLYLLLLTQLNDVSQYVWGKSFGKYKIIPKVSPNKTWEGFLGGLLTISICAGVAAPYLTPLTFAEGVLAGIIISGGGFIGDVVLSAVKRDLQIKDSGGLIPGHGGILDRLDSLTYASPLFFHYLYYLHY